ncbi:ester cyclase [Sorangium sp. So ce1078]|uniref:ester cyclase n=1 Tax=Sorangium sp. So ce1078 TaxID=3133329 RepID=UPI003F6432BC
MNIESVDVVRKLGQAWNKHDLDTVYGLLHEEYREHWNGKLVKQGRDATRAADQAIYDAVPDYRREVDQLFGDGESVASLWRFLGTGPGGPFELPIACFYKVRDGLIVECWIHADAGDLARALGMSTHEKAP